MSNKKTFSIKSRINSFIYAFNGIKSLFRTEHNAWLHITAASLVIFLGILLKIDYREWGLVAIAIGTVFVAEIFNTAIELLTDMISPEINEKAKKVKDLAAGGVLIASVMAAIIGMIVFIPKFIL